MCTRIRRLDWDSDFLGINTFRVDHFDEDSLSIAECVAELREQQAQLSYIFIPPTRDDLLKNWVDAGALHVDTKVVFHAPSEDRGELDSSIRSFRKEEAMPESLRNIIFITGHYSRFRTDTNMPARTYERLYALWLERSIKREIAADVFISEEAGKIHGFVTVEQAEQAAIIGLIAVDPLSQGRGTGSRLINTVFKYSYENGLDLVKVATQLENRGACRFYERVGFTELSRQYVLHLWSKGLL